MKTVKAIKRAGEYLYVHDQFKPSEDEYRELVRLQRGKSVKDVEQHLSEHLSHLERNCDFPKFAHPRRIKRNWKPVIDDLNHRYDDVFAASKVLGCHPYSILKSMSAGITIKGRRFKYAETSL